MSPRSTTHERTGPEESNRPAAVAPATPAEEPATPVAPAGWDRRSIRLDRLGRIARVSALALTVLVVLAVVGVLFYWPVVAIVGRGFFNDGAVDLSGFAEVLSSARFHRVLGQTLAQASIATALSVLLGLPAAHLLYRRQFRGQQVIRALIAVPFMLPTVVVGVAFRTLIIPGGWLGGLGLDQSMAAIVAALVFFNYAVVVRTVGSYWARLDPRLEQAASALGASPARVWWTVTVPRLLPVVAGAAAIVFLFCATAFGIVMTMGGAAYGTIETEIWLQTTQFLDLRTAAVLSVVQFVGVAVLLVFTAVVRRFAERRFVVPAPVRPRGRADVAAAGLTVAVMAILFVLPLVSLVVRSLRTDTGWGFAHYQALTSNDGPFAMSVPMSVAFGNSLRIAAEAGLVAMTLGVAIVIVLSRPVPADAGPTRRRIIRMSSAVFDGLLTMPLGVSGVTVGFGLLITVAMPPLSWATSWWLLPLAQAIVALPLVVRTLLPAMRAIDPRQREAAQALGAPPWRVLCTVDLRALAGSSAVALGFALAVSLGEFGATSFLAQPTAPTAPVLIYRLISHAGSDSAGAAMAASVVLAGFIAIIMMALEVLQRRLVTGSRAESGAWL